jgi:hypothetical protein
VNQDLDTPDSPDPEGTFPINAPNTNHPVHESRLRYQRLLSTVSGPPPEKISLSEVLHFNEKAIKCFCRPH